MLWLRLSSWVRIGRPYTSGAACSTFSPSVSVIPGPLHSCLTSSDPKVMTPEVYGRPIRTHEDNRSQSIAHARCRVSEAAVPVAGNENATERPKCQHDSSANAVGQNHASRTHTVGRC